MAPVKDTFCVMDIGSEECPIEAAADGLISLLLHRHDQNDAGEKLVSAL